VVRSARLEAGNLHGMHPRPLLSPPVSLSTNDLLKCTRKSQRSRYRKEVDPIYTIKPTLALTPLLFRPLLLASVKTNLIDMIALLSLLYGRHNVIPGGSMQPLHEVPVSFDGASGLSWKPAVGLQSDPTIVA
jgi:hypothetical protein